MKHSSLPIIAALLLTPLASLQAAAPASGFLVTQFGATADDAPPDTAAIQKAIDACAKAGGGTVVIPSGRFVSGSIHVKDEVTLHLAEGAVLEGSGDLAHYEPRGWSESLIRFEGVKRAGIEGKGLIDGKGLRDPQYPEREFRTKRPRGPHLVTALNCSDLVFRGVSLARAGNYAFNVRSCQDVVFDGLDIAEGYDGMDHYGCERTVVRDCRIRTGDDAVAGQYNRSSTFSNCVFNSSCNGFRYSCIDLTVTKSRFYGPGDFPHLGGTDRAMDSAFCHYAPPEEKDPTKSPLHVPISDNWRIEDVTIDNVKSIYRFDHERGLWQAGRRPVGTVRFVNVRAARIEQPVLVLGDPRRQASLSFERCVLGFLADGKDPSPFALNVRNARSLELRDVTVTSAAKPAERPVLKCDRVERVLLEGFNYDASTAPEPLLFVEVDKVEKNVPKPASVTRPDAGETKARAQ